MDHKSACDIGDGLESFSSVRGSVPFVVVAEYGVEWN
jgi:hypothetical protein